MKVVCHVFLKTILILILLILSIRAKNFDNSIGSSRSNQTTATHANTMSSLIIFAFVSLNNDKITLKEHTYAYFLISHSFTAPSWPQLKSSWGLLVKLTDMTDCSWASKLWTIRDLSNTLIIASSKAPTKTCPLEEILFIIGSTCWWKSVHQPEIGHS